MAVAHLHTPDRAARTAALIGYPAWDDYWAELDRLEAWRHDQDAVRGLKAMRLAPTLAVCRALLQDQPVPVDQLDPAWRKRYGL